MYQWYQIAALMDTTITMQLHGDVDIDERLSCVLVNTTKYHDQETITINMDRPIHKYTLSYYSESKLRLLKDFNIEYCEPDLYESIIELATKLDDYYMINELIRLLWTIIDVDTFDRFLNLFTDKQLWTEILTHSTMNIRMDDVRCQHYLARVHRAEKYYRRYKTDLFVLIDEVFVNIPHVPELEKLLDQYTIEYQLFK